MAEIRLLSIGLNSTYQKILTFDKFEKNAINRAKSITITTGGKGQNFAVAANTVFQNSATGETGKFIQSFLERKGVNQLIVWNENPTRTCTTLLCNSSNEMTEIIEPSGEISSSQKEDLLFKEHKFRNERILQITGVAICGTFPPGVGPDFYESVAKAKAQYKFLLLVDSFKDIERTLNTGNVDILKINSLEIQTLSGEKDLLHSVRQCFSRYKINYIAITDGPHSAHLFQSDNSNIKKHWEFKIPKLEKVVNPIGAGDTCAAVFLSYFLHGDPIDEAFKKGLGSASASCMDIEPAVFKISDAEKIWKQIEIIEHWD